LKFNIVEILSMGASFSTMIGLIIAVITLRNYNNEKRENLEYKVKKNFFDGKDWIVLQDKSKIDINTKYSFSLHITNSNFHHFAGKIEILGPDGTNVNSTENITMFHFIEINKDKITIELNQATELSKGNISLKFLGTAILKYIDPQIFEISFSKNSLTNLPRTACLMKILN
jgi:hypothetical protein